MSFKLRDASTLALDDNSVEARYRRCSLQEMIQHIDISGHPRLGQAGRLHRSSYRQHEMLTQSGVSISPTRSVDAGSVEGVLSRCSVSTKSSCLYPGHDTLSRRERRSRVKALEKGGRKVIAFGTVVPR